MCSFPSYLLSSIDMNGIRKSSLYEASTTVWLRSTVRVPGPFLTPCKPRPFVFRMLLPRLSRDITMTTLFNNNKNKQINNARPLGRANTRGLQCSDLFTLAVTY